MFGLHAGTNLWWEVFAVDDTALGGWVSNGARLATIIIAVLLTIYKDKILEAAAIAGRGRRSRADGVEAGPARSAFGSHLTYVGTCRPGAEKSFAAGWIPLAM